MDETTSDREDEPELGGERVCWLDEVCDSCGAIGGHRAGCELAASTQDAVPQRPVGPQDS